MTSKEVCCTISQFIYNDILESFEAKGIFSQLHGPSLAASPRIFFLCRFPSVVNTELFSSNLFVVGEDEIKSIHASAFGLLLHRSLALFLFSAARRPASSLLMGFQKRR